MRRLRVFFTALMLAGLLGAVLRQDSAAGEHNTNEAEVRPYAVIPLMRTAPTIDGKIEDGEWQTYHCSRFVSQKRDRLQPRMGEFWLGCDGDKMYVAIRSGVHPQAGIVAKKVPKGNKDIGKAVFDDSIELWFDNDPEKTQGKYFQILLNSNKAVLDSMFEHKDGTSNTWWRPESFVQAHSVADGVWVAEFAIDLSDLEIADPSNEIGIRVCRNYKLGWDQSRWAPNVVSFDSHDTMGRIKFVENAPIVDEVGFQDEKGINVAVRVKNPTDAALPVKVKLGYNAEQQPRYYGEYEETLAPGAEKLFEYRKDFFAAESYPALAEILVTDPAGGIFYHRDVKWDTKPKQAIWAKAATAKAEEATEFAIEWHPTPKMLRWKADYKALKGKEKIKSLRLRLIEEKEGAEIQTLTFPAPEKFALEERTILKDLPDGRFFVELYLDAEKPAEKPARKHLFEQASDFPWLVEQKKHKIGGRDRVIPPFTPIEIDGTTVSTVLRKHTLNGLGLWDQVVADGVELLAEPMRLEAQVGGKTIRAEGSEVKFPRPRPNRAKAEAAWTAGPLHGKTITEIDFDGCMKVTMKLKQKGGETIDSLELVIPVKDEVAPLMHACGDGLRINYAGAVHEGQGEVWTSTRASRADLMGTFLPYIWVGHEGPGLCWFGANDRDWVVDPENEVAAQALVREGDTLYLRVRLIQMPATLEREHTVVFGLMASPAKPMPKDPHWRRMGLTGGGSTVTTFLGMCMYWGGHVFGVMPLNNDWTVVRKIAEAAKFGHRDEEWFEEYFKRTNNIFKAEVNWSSAKLGHLLVPYTNIRGAITYTKSWRVYQDEWRRGNFMQRTTDMGRNRGSTDFVVIPTPSRIDFLMWHYQKFFENGMDGIYWDNICIYPNSNLVTGDGYVRPDGFIQPEGDIWRIREVTKRTAQLSHEMGRPNVNMPHMTNAALIPVFSWTGFYLGWEWRYGDSDFQDRFNRDYIRAINIARQTGNYPGVLGGHARDPWILRTRAGVVLTHEIASTVDKFSRAVRQMLLAEGIGTDSARTYNYWTKNPVAQIHGIDSSWIVHDFEKRVVIILCDWGGGGEAIVTLDTARLGLPDSFTAKNWETPEETMLAVDGTFTVPGIKKHDLRVLVIEK